MTSLIVLLCIILIAIVMVQIGKVYELTTQIKGEEATMRDNSKWNGWLSLIFLVVFLIGVVWSAYSYKNVMLGFGPHESASEHGKTLDSIFNVTLFFTGIVFVLTHLALFYFAYQYRWQKGRKVKFIPHDNRLEVWWTAIPAVVMTFLVVRGLNAWNTVMADVTPDEDYIEIEATGQQFNWILRYPGPDGKIGTRNYKLTSPTNQLGIDFTDPKSWDDVVLPGGEFYLPEGKKVRVRIVAKDVLHNFDLPHFRVKMDAVPGMPTYFIFRPTTSTAEYRAQLRHYPEYNEPFDAAEPNGPKRWEKFDYELACAELCGKGHYSMRRVLKVVSQEEFDAWYKTQKSFYLTEIRGKEGDPNLQKTLDAEVRQRAAEFSENMKKAVEATDATAKTLPLNHINFETGSATLTADSKYELDNLVTALNTYPAINVEVAGHTDNVGDPAVNLQLSAARASSVVKYLVDRGISAGRLTAKGYGETKPLVPNDSPENQAKNRRTAFTILN
ncbi:MAG: OmpA family protein [Saprospiraceae bacterium]|nr:OmpA family protein [Saprospiraceae bacterium]